MSNTISDSIIENQKTALVLSGGGSRGAYEIGVWKALRELNIRIDIVTGTSVGAINGALVVQGDFPSSEALWHTIETDMIFDLELNSKEVSHDNTLPSEKLLTYAKHIILNGGAGTEGLLALLHKYIDEDMVRNSGIQYGLVTTEFPSMEGHFLFLEDIPKGRLTDFILASASCFPAAKKYQIDDRQFIDGGYRDNLPLEMAIEKGATNIIAVDLQAAGIVHKSAIDKATKTCRSFKIIKTPLDLGNFLIFDKSNTERIMTLGYLDTMRQFNKYDGVRYTFARGEFNHHQLLGADSLAFLLELDPCVVYEKNSLISAAVDSLLKIKNNPAISFKESIGDVEIKGHLLLYIAKSLKEDEEKSPFLQPKLFKLMQDEIRAANFLARYII